MFTNTYVHIPQLQVGLHVCTYVRVVTYVKIETSGVNFQFVSKHQMSFTSPTATAAQVSAKVGRYFLFFLLLQACLYVHMGEYNSHYAICKRKWQP